MSDAAPHDREHDLSEEDLANARGLVPIACVDVLPWRCAEQGALEICLIERQDRSGQWNLIGGRIRRTEEIDAAVRRHLLGALGPEVRWARSDFSHPEAVGQYFLTRTLGHGFDRNPVYRSARRVALWSCGCRTRGSSGSRSAK